MRGRAVKACRQRWPGLRSSPKPPAPRQKKILPPAISSARLWPGLATFPAIALSSVLTQGALTQGLMSETPFTTGINPGHTLLYLLNATDFDGGEAATIS